MSAPDLANSYQTAVEKRVNFNWDETRRMLRLWQLSMEAKHGVQLKLDYMELVKADGSRISQPCAFLTMMTTEVAMIDEDGATLSLDANDVPEDQIKELPPLVLKSDHIAIEHKKSNDFESVRATGLMGDISNELAKTNKEYAQETLVECMRAALLVACHAKAKGWDAVSFGPTTTNPIYKMALFVACKEVELNCLSEPEDHNLPKDTILGEELKSALFGALTDIRKEPRSFINFNAYQQSQSMPLAA